MERRGLYTAATISVAVLLAYAPATARGEEAAESPQRPGEAETNARRDEARQLFERGLQAFDAGRIDEACGLFQRSFDLRPSRSPLYNLAMCRREAGESAAAIEAFRQYVNMAGPALSDAERTEIEAMVSEMGGSLVRPAPVEHPATPEPAGPEPEPTEPEPTPATPVAPEHSAAQVNRAWFWATAATAVALGIGATATGALAYGTNQDFRQNGDADLREQGQALQLATNVLIGLAGASAVAAFVLAFFTEWHRDEPAADAARLSARLAPGAMVITW
jgi:tetratricopeptide (TPR) repeat protein